MNPEPDVQEPALQISANWSTPSPIPEAEPDIEQNDDIPCIADQAEANGWKSDYYSFGKLDDQGTDYFNPSLVMREDGIWMLTRASGLHPRGFMYGQNAIVAFKLDDTGKQPHHGKILHWNDALNLQHFEDPRGFYHPRLGQTMMGCCTFMWNGPGDWTGALQVFGAFDDNWICKKVDYPKIGGNPGKVEKVPHKDYEKNWVWWLHKDRLHLLYKANPWTVYTFENRWSERTEYKSEGITWPYGEIRGGTSPIQVGDLFFTFHHSSLPWKGRYRRYYAGAIGFETTPPYKPRLITAEPILQGSQNDVWAQRKPLVVFPCGALYLNNHWLVSMGVNDMKSAWLELSHESLLERMRPIDDVSGQIFQSAIPDLSRKQEPKASVPSPQKDSEEPESPAQTTPKTKKRRKTFSPEALENLRRAAAKARAARMSKRNGGDASCNPSGTRLIQPTQEGTQSGNAAVTFKPKRRRRKYKRVTAEARRKALEEYKTPKTGCPECDCTVRISSFPDGRELWQCGHMTVPKKLLATEEVTE